MIAAEGDSLIWGWQGINSAGKDIQSVNAPPIVLREILQAQLGSGVSVANNAVPGSTVLEALSGAAPYSLPLASRLAATHAQIVLADYGANDFSMESIDSYISGLQTWINIVRSMGMIPVLEEPNPSCKAGGENLTLFVQAMDSVAQQQGVPLIQQYQYILSLPTWQYLLVDCAHPNDALYAIKAEREAQVLAPLVKSLQ